MDNCFRWQPENSTYSSPLTETCPYQQNLDTYPIAVIVLQAKTNRLADLKPLVSRLLSAIACAQPGAPLLIGDA